MLALWASKKLLDAKLPGHWHPPTLGSSQVGRVKHTLLIRPRGKPRPASTQGPGASSRQGHVLPSFIHHEVKSQPLFVWPFAGDQFVFIQLPQTCPPGGDGSWRRWVSVPCFPLLDSSAGSYSKTQEGGFLLTWGCVSVQSTYNLLEWSCI